jgi:DNA-binding NarL/FixJ family response regulator
MKSSQKKKILIVSNTEGMKNREIAELLHLSEHTVRNHLFRIYERLGISNRAELLLYMYRQEPSVAASSDPILTA